MPCACRPLTLACRRCRVTFLAAAAPACWLAGPLQTAQQPPVPVPGWSTPSLGLRPACRTVRLEPTTMCNPRKVSALGRPSPRLVMRGFSCAHSTAAPTPAAAMALKQQNLAGSQGMYHQSDVGAVSIADHFAHSMRSTSGSSRSNRLHIGNSRQLVTPGLTS